MKKAKIFLGAIAVFAVVGGALAFKAKTFGQDFCTRAIAAGEGACQASYTGKILAVSGIKTYYYTTTDDKLACTLTQCTSTTSLTTIE